MDLDLEKLEPKSQKVTLRGVTFEVYPAKVRALLEIEKYFEELKEMSGSDAVKRAFDILEPLIPDFKKKKIDFTIKQMYSLLNYVNDAGLEHNTEKEEVKKDSKKK